MSSSVSNPAGPDKAGPDKAGPNTAGANQPGTGNANSAATALRHSASDIASPWRGRPRTWLSMPSPAPIATPVFWTLLVLLVGVIAATGPILTSDGPAHVSMAHYMVHRGDPAWPMLNRIYEINRSLSPNALGHFLLAGLMLVFPPLVSEQGLQILCAVSVPLAARLTLRRLAPEAGWIALFFIPVALQRMFFMGLYNFCLSVTGCLLCIWAFLRFREKASAGNGVLLAVMLLLTLAAQASGWMEAVVAIGTIAAIDFARRLWNGEAVLDVLRFPVALGLTLLPGLVLFALFALGGAGPHEVSYGPSPFTRLMTVVRGDPFAPIGRSTALAGLVLGLTLVLLAVSGGVAFWRAPRQEETRRSDTHQRGTHQRGNSGLRLALCVLPISFLAFVMIIPDRAGGGWTHTWRAEPFPYIGLALACAMLPTYRPVRLLAVTAATLGGLVSIWMMLWVQVWQVPEAAREFAEADKLIGPHCTIAPLLGQFKLDPPNTARLFYHPLFHLASRFELRSDRPVLFSYGARLPVYPVRFRPNADPHRLLYGWEPGQSDTHVYKIDIAGFEAASGIAVDYALLWDMPEPGEISPFSAIRPSVVGAGYQLVYRSSGGRMELYRRPGPGGCAKP